MKLFISSGTLGLAILAALAIPSAYADEWGGGGYIGGNFGRTFTKVDEDRIVHELLGPGFTTTEIDHHDRDNGFKLFGGYGFNRNVAIEAGYYNLGKFRYNAITLPAGTLSGTSKFEGVNLDLVLSAPLGERFSVFGRVGATWGTTRNSFDETGDVDILGPESRRRGGSYKFGAGLQYDINHAVALRAEAERYGIHDAIGEKDHIDLLSLGLVFRFGGEVTEVARPEPVAYTPPPQPTVDCSTMDDDHDSVNNCNDRCPNSPAGQTVGADGCPVPAPEPVAPPPKPFRG